MNFSIIVPTFNNLKYLKFFLNSIKNNSNFSHEIILHINNGSDGTLEYALKNNLKHTLSKTNIGLCSSMNRAYSLATTDYILYAHDDMYFCKDWDIFLSDEIKKQDNNFYYLSGTNISTRYGLINFDCGSTIEDFDINKFNTFCSEDKTPDLQSSHWAPHLVHRELWDKIGGFSEEFNPGMGSDPDFNMKLWNKGVRIFKGINDFRVYHFSSITTRKKIGISRNKGDLTFLKKWGISIKFFKKHYLRSRTKFVFSLKEPDKNFSYYFDLLICKIMYLVKIF